MSHSPISVIIPTHNRQEKLADTLATLLPQSIGVTDYEVIIVDDGSSPPVTLPARGDSSELRLLRLAGGERSAARNAGAAAARSELLVFIDDDISVANDFLRVYLDAHHKWPDALLVGAIRLPGEATATPFGRFRQRLEDKGLPTQAGLTSRPNFCTAANMAISRKRFADLGGFDHEIASGEDQDFALRHTASGGEISFVPAARVIHRDGAIDLKSYCRRVEWGSRMLAPFCHRYPDFEDTRIREAVNGRLRLGNEPIGQSVRKLIKSLFSLKPIVPLPLGLAALLESIAPNSALLDRLYRLNLGLHIFRGYRDGMTGRNVGEGGSAVAAAGSAPIGDRR